MLPDHLKGSFLSYSVDFKEKGNLLKCTLSPPFMLGEGLCAQRELQISQVNVSWLANTLHDKIPNPRVYFLQIQGPTKMALE